MLLKFKEQSSNRVMRVQIQDDSRPAWTVQPQAHAAS